MIEQISVLETAIGEKIVSSKPVGGGCIADSKIIETLSGKKYFLKSYSDSHANILKNEANGLKEIARSKSIKVPEVILQNESHLLLEFIESGKRGSTFSEKFGRQFARMHKTTSDSFGFYENNFIGANPQINLPQRKNWTEFYWENRLLFQYKLAERNGYSNSEFKTLFNKLEKALPQILDGTEEKPTLLHGDLWSGNYLVDTEGNPVLIDPAVYYGHREADLGMTLLFGGFDSMFYKAYDEEFPLVYGWRDRMDLYKLYHVINHLNLFGAGYYSQTVSIIKKYTG